MRQIGIVVEQTLKRGDRGFVVAAIGRHLHVGEGDLVVRRLAQHLRMQSLLLVAGILSQYRLNRDEQRNDRRADGNQAPSRSAGP